MSRDWNTFLKKIAFSDTFLRGVSIVNILCLKKFGK